jgi:hypothetical protein
MHTTDVIQRVHAKLAELGVPEHISGVEKVPSKVRVRVFSNKQLRTVELRRNITRPELEQKLGELAAAWQLYQQGQTDLVDFTR